MIKKIYGKECKKKRETTLENKGVQLNTETNKSIAGTTKQDSSEIIPMTKLTMKCVNANNTESNQTRSGLAVKRRVKRAGSIITSVTTSIVNGSNCNQTKNTTQCMYSLLNAH